MFSKRGLSDVITTVLIILLALAAVAIVWSFVMPLIQRAGEEVNSDCFTISLTPESCTYNSATGDATIRVSRGAGEGVLTDMKFIFNDGERVTDAGDSLEVLEQRSYDVPMNGVTPTTFNVAAVSGANDKVCPVVSTPVDCN